MGEEDTASSASSDPSDPSDPSQDGNGEGHEESMGKQTKTQNPKPCPPMISESYSYFSTESRNAQRKMLTNFLYDSLRRDDEVSNMHISFVIKSIHFLAPFLMILAGVFAPMWIVYSLFILCILTKILFWYLNGCFLSSVEYKLNKKLDINVVDPLVLAFGEEITAKSRVDVTIKATNWLITFLAAMIIWKENRGSLMKEVS